MSLVGWEKKEGDQRLLKGIISILSFSELARLKEERPGKKVAKGKRSQEKSMPRNGKAGGTKPNQIGNGCRITNPEVIPRIAALCTLYLLIDCPYCTNIPDNVVWVDN